MVTMPPTRAGVQPTEIVASPGVTVMPVGALGIPGIPRMVVDDGPQPKSSQALTATLYVEPFFKLLKVQVVAVRELSAMAHFADGDDVTT